MKFPQPRISKAPNSLPASFSFFNKDPKLSVCFAGDTGPSAPQSMLYSRAGFHTLWMQAVMQTRDVWNSAFRIWEILWIAFPWHVLVVDTALKCYGKLSKRESPSFWTSIRNAWEVFYKRTVASLLWVPNSWQRQYQREKKTKIKWELFLLKG